MSEGRPNLQTWAAGLLFLGLAGFIGYSLPRPENPKTVGTSTPKDTNATDKGAQAKQVFTPPRDDEIPDDDFGKMIRLGSDIFHDTQNNAKEFVGNALQCANCHIDRGRLANSAPLWAAYVAYPAYRDKNGHVNTFQELANAAGFIKANMPLSQGNTLSDQEAWDLATFIDSQERPHDPRFSGSVADIRKKYHDSPMSMYGQLVNGVVLGQNSPPSGPPKEE